MQALFIKFYGDDVDKKRYSFSIQKPSDIITVRKLVYSTAYISNIIQLQLQMLNKTSKVLEIHKCTVHTLNIVQLYI